MKSDAPHEIARQLTASLRWYLESLKESGVTGLPVAQRPLPETFASSEPPHAPAQSTVTSSLRPPSLMQSQPAVSPPVSLPAKREEVSAMRTPTTDLFASAALDKVSSLEGLRAEIGDCHRCKLCHGRTNIVFGVGDPQAELMFVGEGPGRDEDLKGEPFVGRAGQLLTEIITKGMKMRRDEVYIANVVKCRPPENRNPEPDEITACQPFLMKQVELVKPRIIIALGTFAAQTLLQSKTPISRLRGVWHSYQGVKLMPTLHPAYLLRNPNDKRLVWQDIQAVLREMGRL